MACRYEEQVYQSMGTVDACGCPLCPYKNLAECYEIGGGTMATHDTIQTMAAAVHDAEHNARLAIRGAAKGQPSGAHMAEAVQVLFDTVLVLQKEVNPLQEKPTM